MMREIRGALIVLVLFVGALALGVWIAGCDGYCDNWHCPAPDASAAAVVTACEPTPPPDAGCDGIVGCINTGTATSPFPE